MADGLFKSGASLMNNIANTFGRRTPGEPAPKTSPNPVSHGYPASQPQQAPYQGTQPYQGMQGQPQQAAYDPYAAQQLVGTFSVPPAAPVPVFGHGVHAQQGSQHPTHQELAAQGSLAPRLSSVATIQAGDAYDAGLNEAQSDAPTGIRQAITFGRTPFTTTLVDATRQAMVEPEHALSEAPPSLYPGNQPAVRPSGFLPLGSLALQRAEDVLRAANTEFEERVGDRVELPLGVLINQRDRALRELAETQAQAEHRVRDLAAQHERTMNLLVQQHSERVATLQNNFVEQERALASSLANDVPADRNSGTLTESGSELSPSEWAATQRELLESRSAIAELRRELDDVQTDLARVQAERDEAARASDELRAELLTEIQTLQQEAKASRDEAIDLQARFDAAERALVDTRDQAAGEIATWSERMTELRLSLVPNSLTPSSAPLPLPTMPPAGFPNPSLGSASSWANSPLPPPANIAWSNQPSNGSPTLGTMPPPVPHSANPGATLQGVAPPYIYPSDAPAFLQPGSQPGAPVPPAPPSGQHSAPQGWGVPAATVRDVPALEKRRT